MIEVKSEGPRERSASRNNSRQNEHARLPPNARNDLQGQSVMSYLCTLIMLWLEQKVVQHVCILVYGIILR